MACLKKLLIGFFDIFFKLVLNTDRLRADTAAPREVLKQSFL